jgi:hypothetical protein
VPVPTISGIVEGANLTWIDVRFSTAGGIALDEPSILDDTGDLRHEFTISGAGYAGSLATVAPTRLGSTCW